MNKLSVQKGQSSVTKPSVMTEIVVQNLANSLQSGLSVSAACNYAGISTSAYYENIKNRPSLGNYFELSKNLSLEIARQNIHVAINNGDLKASMWYLDRYDKSNRNERPAITRRLRYKKEELELEESST